MMPEVSKETPILLASKVGKPWEMLVTHYYRHLWTISNRQRQVIPVYDLSKRRQVCMLYVVVEQQSQI